MKKEKPIRIVFDLGDKIRVSPPIWPKHKLKIQPGDLSQFVPYGTGWYGYQKNFGHPIKTAPLHEPSGGVIYFGCHVKKEDFDALLRLTEVEVKSKKYAVFFAESEQPKEDGYLVQMRIVTKFALRCMFNALDENEYNEFPEQELTIGETLWRFIEEARIRWGTSFLADAEKGLRGVFGGDGHFAREELAFGFMIENQYHGVYRIWARAWLVTK